MSIRNSNFRIFPFTFSIPTISARFASLSGKHFRIILSKYLVVKKNVISSLVARCIRYTLESIFFFRCAVSVLFRIKRTFTFFVLLVLSNGRSRFRLHFLLDESRTIRSNRCSLEVFHAFSKILSRSMKD